MATLWQLFSNSHSHISVHNPTFLANHIPIGIDNNSTKRTEDITGMKEEENSTKNGTVSWQLSHRIK